MTIEDDIRMIFDKMDIEKGHLSLHDFSTPISTIPKQRADGKIISLDGKLRSVITYGAITNRGQYGIIQRSLHDRKHNVVVKRPCRSAISLQPEACLQELCRMHLERNLICSAIPEVYDIFVFADEVRFSMEWIEGVDSLKFLSEVADGELEAAFINILLQVCFILEILGRELKFDHRDLKPENIWIRRLSVPSNYVISIDGITYMIEILHQVILLDFGFACIGSMVPPMSLAQDVIPPMDPCPKTGRDMYHILSRFLNESTISRRLSKRLYDTMVEWMKPYQVKNGGLLYLITSDAHFENRRLKPGAIIKWLLSVWRS